MKNLLKLSYLSSGTTLGVAACCILPMILILSGFGGSWLAIFGKIAALSYGALALSIVVIAMAWFTAYRQHALHKLRFWLTGSTVMTFLSGVIVMNEDWLNTQLMNWI